MTNRRSTQLATLALALALPLAALAQDATPPAEGAETGTEFSTGQPAGAADVAEGDIPEGGLYVTEVIGDWEIRCVKTASGFDPCQMYQLLTDTKDNPTSEVTVVGLTESGEAVAGATVLTPLETLLTQMVTIVIDGGQAKRYPFTWCDQFGCYSRIGFTGPELDQMKRGAKALVGRVRTPGRPSPSGS
jgi:invasion protein IalB